MSNAAIDSTIRSAKLKTLEAVHEQTVSLTALFCMFLKIGCVSFGGFMALISVIADTVVEKHKLLTNDEILDGISLANLLPGPQGVNCVAYIGYRLRGAMGALVCSVGVLLPIVVLMIGLTSLYLTYASQLPALGSFFAGFVPAVAAILVTVVHRMSRHVLKGWREVVLALAAALALFFAPQALKLDVTVWIVAGFGIMGYSMFRQPGAVAPARTSRLPWLRLSVPLFALALLLVVFLAQPALDPNGLPQMALTFGGLSLMLFGGGYVLIPMIQDVVVSNYQWLTTQQFLDGMALSQVTPGPILVIATFIAQKVTTGESGLVMGVLGALVGTAAIFGPPAILMVTASQVLDDIRQSPTIKAAMQGIRCGMVGMIAVSAVVILRAALPAWPEALSATTLAEYVGLLWPTMALFVAALVAMMKCRIDVVWVIPAAGLCGLVVF